MAKAKTVKKPKFDSRATSFDFGLNVKPKGKSKAKGGRRSGAGGGS